MLILSLMTNDDKQAERPQPPREKSAAEKARNARWFGRIRIQKQLRDMDHHAEQDEYRANRRT